MSRERALAIVTWSLRIGLAGVLGYAGVLKLLEPAAFAEDIQNYRLLPDAWAGPLALGVPVLELVVAVGLLLPSHVSGAGLVSGALFTTFALAMAQAKLRGIDLECGCFGGTSRVSWLTVAFDLGLSALAFLVAWAAVRRRAPVVQQAT